MKGRYFLLKIGLILVCVLCVSFGPLGRSMAQQKEPVTIKNWVVNWAETMEESRILSTDLKKLGIETELITGNLDTWVGAIVGKRPNPYDIVTMTWTGGAPDRVDASFWLTELFHSSRAVAGARNYGSYINKEYDEIVDAQQREMDPKKRQQLVWKAQEIIHRDNPFFPVVHHDYVQAYNHDTIGDAIVTMGSGVGYPLNPWTFLKAKPKTDRKEMRIVTLYDISGLNPFAAIEAATEAWIKMTYDPLVRLDKDSNLIPWAAESWRAVDSTTVDIVLREGMKFHDGRPVTVEDVKFTYDYVTKWKFPRFLKFAKYIDSVQIIGDRKIRFKLKEPYAPFISITLWDLFIAPKHIWEKIPQSVGLSNPLDYPNLNPVGSGPYQIVEWKKGELMHLKANKNHFSPPNFDGLYSIVTPTKEGIIAALEKGDADTMGFWLDRKQAASLSSLRHLTVIRAPNYGFHEFRPTLNRKPFSDPRFREAFQYAINRKEMLNIVFGGNGTICRNTPINPMNKLWHNPKVPIIEFDLDKARAILKKAGYTWDDKGRLCYP